MSATKAKAKKVPELTDADVITLVQGTPGSVLTDSDLWKAFIGAVNREAADFKGDVKTEKGRDIIRAKKFRFVKFRTGIEDARKDMTEHWRKQTDAVNKVGKVARETLQELQDKISAPLDAWTEAQKTREAEIQETIARLRSYAGLVSANDTPETVMERLTWVRGINDLNEERYGEWLVVAENEQRLTIAALEVAHARLVQEAKDREDLRLFREAQAKQEADREAAAQRQAQAEHDARVAKEATEQAIRDQSAALEQAEQRRVKFYRDSIGNLDRSSAFLGGDPSSAQVQERIEAITALLPLQMEEFTDEATRVHSEVLERLNVALELAKQREAEKAEADRKAQEAREEAIRKQATEFERARAAAPPISPTRAREMAVNRAAVAALMIEGKCSEVTARAIVTAIVQGKIPAVSISYA